MSNTRIKPKTWTLTAVFLRVHIVSYQLSKSADIVAQLCDENGKVIDRYTLTLEADEFLLWGYDDSWVVVWVCEKLGLEIDMNHADLEVEHSEEEDI